MIFFFYIYYRKNFFLVEVFFMDLYVNICICIIFGVDIFDDCIVKDLVVVELIWYFIIF